MNSIDRVTANGITQTYQSQAGSTNATSAAPTTGKPHHAHHQHHTQSADSVTLSDHAKSLASARSAVENAPDVREQKVADIKQQVDAGTYSVSSQVLARKMLYQQQQQ